MFTQRNNVPEPQRLPPTRDALVLHIMRSNFQVAEWKFALNTDHAPKDGKLAIKWMTKNPAPDEVLEFITTARRRNVLPTNDSAMLLIIGSLGRG